MANQCLIWLKQRWRLLFIILIPLILLPLPIVNNSSQAKCGYVVLILSIFWITEVIPLAITSLLPLILFPMAGVLEAADVAESYFQDIIALFFGSLAFAYAIESVNLHHRIALFVLRYVGTSTKRSMGGLMIVTAFLSMWINNSAATSIMLPVALAICTELEHHGKDYQDKKQTIKMTTVAVNEVISLTEPEIFNEAVKQEVLLDAFRLEETRTEVPVEVKTSFRFPWQRQVPLTTNQLREKYFDEIKKGFLLATAYSATIGGLASLVGTAPNVFVKGFAETAYEDTDFRITFINFLLYAFPVAFIMLIFCWLWLQLCYNRKEFFQCRTDPETRAVQVDLKAMLVKRYNDLGKPNWNEYCIGIIFILMILLWLTREFGDTRGWGILFREKYISDSTVAMFAGVLPLILPNSNPFKSNWKYAPIVQWDNLVKNISWGAIFLLGAGLSVAAAFTHSGLSDSVAEALRFLTDIPRTALILIIIVISGLFTEVTSNLSTASIFLPVLDSVARSAHIHPAYLILPCTLAVSLAFMLPIATPPNAIVFSSGHLQVIDMIKTGIIMNIVGFLIIFFAATTWMPKIYNLNDQTTEIFFSINTTRLL